MAHKTLVNGTAYDITGGMTLVEGTSYSIKGGKTLMGGTLYDFSFALPAGVLDLFGSSSSGSGINCITYADGYWVVGGRCYDGTNYYARIAYATSLDGTWTIVDVWSGGSDYLYCITNANGYWVVGGRHYDGSTCYARLAYAGRPEDLGNTE